MTYEQLSKQTTQIDLPCVGENEDGETVIITHGCDKLQGRFFQTSTHQNNGWTRVNRFFENGSTEEIYNKE